MVYLLVNNQKADGLMKKLLLCLFLTGCGVTSWQRMMDAHQDLHSPKMEQAIKEAINGIERR